MLVSCSLLLYFAVIFAHSSRKAREKNAVYKHLFDWCDGFRLALFEFPFRPGKKPSKRNFFGSRCYKQKAGSL